MVGRAAGLAAIAGLVLPNLADRALATTAAEEGNAWLVRGLEDFSAETRVALAKAGKPTWHKIEADGVTVRTLINAVCGNQNDLSRDYVTAETLRINGVEHDQEVLVKGEVLAIPFCLKMDRNVEVDVTRGDNPSSIVTEQSGVVADLQTLRRTYDINRDKYRDFGEFERNLRIGDPIKVLFSSAPTVFVPKVSGVAPLAIVREHEPASVTRRAESAFAMLSEKQSAEPPPVVPQHISSPSTGELHLVSAMMLSPSQEAAACGSSGGAYQNLDAAAIKAAYNASLEARRLRGLSGNVAAQVGIIDTGLAGLGSDFFQSKYFLQNEMEKEPPGRPGEDDDIAGYRRDFKDDIYGANLDHTGDISPYNDDAFRQISHGTQMTALLLGGKGVVEGWLSQLNNPPIQVKVFKFTRRPDGPAVTRMADAASLTTAIDYLADSGVTAINMSLAAETRTMSMRATLQDKPKILFVVAAGNGRPGMVPVGIELGFVNTILPASLGGYGQVPNVISVAAHGYDGNRATFSNFSAEKVNFLAPGCGLLAPNRKGVFERVSGSSAAAAITTFGAALVRSLGPPDMPPEDVKDRLILSTDFDSGLKGHAKMPGRLNIIKAVGIYDDIIEQGSRQPRYIHGKINLVDRRRFLAACENFASQLSAISDEDIVKIVPNIKRTDGGLELKLWLKRTPLEEFTCTQKSESVVQLFEHIIVDGKSYGPLKLADIKEIIFRQYY